LFKEPERGFVKHGNLGHVPEKALPLIETFRDEFGDFHKIVLSIDGPKIEEDHRLKGLFRRIIEIDNPMAIITFPDPKGLAPFR
jgi:hypothetical protein